MDTSSRIDPEISRRLDLLKFLLVVGVVLIHAERAIHAYMPDPGLTLRVVNTFLGWNLLQVCVPMLFVISGFLFATSSPSPGLREYLRMLGRKLRTIGVPYLFFNTLAVLIILAFRKFPYIGDIHTLEERGIFSLITGIGGLPIISPLWFLRDLLFLFALSPLFRFLAARVPLAGLAAVFLVWNLPFGAYIGGLETRGVFFFFAGYVLAATRSRLDMAQGASAAIGVAYVLLLVCGTYMDVEGAPDYAAYVVKNVGALLGVPFLWRLSAIPALRDSRVLAALSGYAVFLYLLHEPTLSLIIYFSRFVFVPAGTLGGLFLYLSTAAMTVALVLWAGVLLVSHAPTVYGFLTGFRYPARPCGAVGAKGKGA